MTRPDVYHPIACELHDRLESLATLRRVVRIVARDRRGTAREWDDRIDDVFTRGGEEFLRTGAGDLIRLDRLDSVDGVPFQSRPPGPPAREPTP